MKSLLCAIGLTLSVTTMLCGCVAPPTNVDDWSNAHPFQLSTDYQNPRVNDKPDSWPIAYRLTGVYKLDHRSNRLSYRIDKIVMQTTTEKFGSIQVKSLQLGYCYFLHGDTWHMIPVPTVEESDRGAKLGIVLDQVGKVYSKTNIGALSLSFDESVDLKKAWPCSGLWETSNGSFGFVPAHPKGLQTIE